MAFIQRRSHSLFASTRLSESEGETMRGAASEAWLGTDQVAIPATLYDAHIEAMADWIVSNGRRLHFGTSAVVADVFAAVESSPSNK